MSVSPKVQILTAIAVAAAMVASCVAFVPDTSEASRTDDYQYGNTFGMDLADVNGFFLEWTGNTLGGWVDSYLKDKMCPPYTKMHTATDAKAEFALTRNTEQDGDSLDITDHLVGYFEVIIDLEGDGPFPLPGTYEAKSGESGYDLMMRVFKESTAPDSHRHYYIELLLYVDTVVVSHCNLSTGELEDADVDAKIMVLDLEEHNIFVNPVTDDDGNVTAIVVDNDEVKVENNIFLDLKLKLDMDGMKVISDEGSWHIDPVVTVIVKKAAVSTDLADSIGTIILERMEENSESVTLPELILKLLRGGGRNIDLVQTVESLTSSDLPETPFLLHFDAEPYTDGNGYQYTKLMEPDDHTKALTLSKGAYVLNCVDLLRLIPDSFFGDQGHEIKIALGVALHLAGWDNIDVKDLSGAGGLEIRRECDSVDGYVKKAMASDEEEHYSLPTAYVAVAGVGIAISVMVPLLIWRRII